MIKKTLNRIILLLGIFLMVGVMTSPDLRTTIGNIIGTLLNPLLILLPRHMIIFILAAITGLYASLIQKYTMDWELMKRVQERMKNIQTEFRQAQLANNVQKIKKLEAQRTEMLADQMEMMKQQFKPMLYISVISIPLFLWAYTIVTPFNWDEIPGNDSSKLINFLEKNQGVEWVKKAQIEKSHDSRVITVSNGKNSYTLTMNEGKTSVILDANNNRISELPMENENGKLNIYTPDESMSFPFWGKQKLNGNLFGPFQYWLFWYFLCSIPISQMTRKALNIGGI